MALSRVLLLSAAAAGAAQLAQDNATNVSAVFAKECTEHFAEGHIPSTDGTFLCRKKGSTTFYATMYDTKIHCPKFSAYLMKGSNEAKDKNTRRGFKIDPLVPAADQAHSTDAPFKDGHDIGHLAPSAAFSWDKSAGGAWENTYIMTNVAPQGRYMNEHPWAMLEGHVRKFSVAKSLELYVITGVIQAAKPEMSAGDAIPEYYYKAVCDLKNGQSFASLGDNGNTCKECGVTTFQTVSKVEKMLGYTLFPTSCKTTKVDEKYWGWSKSALEADSTIMV